jgi:glycosyltransferase involved in cell wall biosynthesis
MSKHIVLFTPFPPTLGGGAAILRSLVPHLDGFRIEWLYAAPGNDDRPGATRIAGPLTGGGRWRDLSRTTALWSGLETRRMQSLVLALRERRADGYWVVGHNEAALIARALARRGERVHLTIHDDVPDGILGRSVRYRYLRRLARLQYASALRSVRSRDYITDRMRVRYRDGFGADGVVIHPFLATLPAIPPFTRVAGELSVGHIGTIYAIPEWRVFLQALGSLARKRGLRPRMLMVGLDKFHSVAQEFPGVVEILPETPESAAVGRLAATDLCYAMYPFNPAAEVFRQTSLPTKLSTYVQSRKSVLAHAPAATSLGDVVEKYGIGRACSEMAVPAVEAAIASVLDTPVPEQTFEVVRREVYGIDNVERMASCLERLVS